MPEPNFQDRVKHKTSAENTTGIVIAKYPVEQAAEIAFQRGCAKSVTNLRYQMTRAFRPINYFLDIRTDDDKIIYATPAENWETISTEEERFE